MGNARTTRLQRPDALEQFRLDHDLSYSQLAQRIGKAVGVWRDSSTWSRYCRAVVPPSPRTARAAAKFLAAQSSSSSSAAGASR